MSDTKKTSKDQLVTPRKSVHVVYLSCPHCGEEMEDITLCTECGEPMRVINVVEKFGEEAEKLLEELKKKTLSKSEDDEEEEAEYVTTDEEQPNIILMGGNDAHVDDGGIDPTSAGDDEGLDVIFPDDGDSGDSHAKVEALGDDELSKALEQLDEEDDTSSEDFSFGDDGDIPEL